MTRQKKEIVKKIECIQTGMEMDDLMGYGLPPKVYESREREIYSLLEQLVRLQHYTCVEKMLFDARGCDES